MRTLPQDTSQAENTCTSLGRRNRVTSKNTRPQSREEIWLPRKQKISKKLNQKNKTNFSRTFFKVKNFPHLPLSCSYKWMPEKQPSSHTPSGWSFLKPCHPQSSNNQLWSVSIWNQNKKTQKFIIRRPSCTPYINPKPSMLPMPHIKLVKLLTTSHPFLIAMQPLGLQYQEFIHNYLLPQPIAFAYKPPKPFT